MTDAATTRPDYTTSDETAWLGPAALEWYERNPKTVDELDAVYEQNYKIPRTTIAEWQLRGVPRDLSVLEVGVGTGLQLDVLRRLGFTGPLHGCDISADLVARCNYPCQVADARDLPYADRSFDMVITSGMLIHVPMEDKRQALREIGRVARGFVAGLEYTHSDPMRISFHDLPPAWIGPFVRWWMAVVPDMYLIRSETLYRTGAATATVYLMGRPIKDDDDDANDEREPATP